MKTADLRHAAAAIIASATLFVIACGHALASDITVARAEVNIRNDIITLDADSEFEFSDDAIEALNSGIPLYIDLEVRLLRPRRYLWADEVYATHRRFALERHALTNRFVLTELITDERRVHDSLDLAIADLAHIRDLPLIEAGSIPLKTASEIALRLSLDIDALPAPMIPLAYVSPGWHMSSGWYQWPTNL